MTKAATVTDPAPLEYLRKADPVLARVIDAHPGLPAARVARRAAAVRRVRNARLPGAGPAAVGRRDADDPVPVGGALRRSPAQGRGAPGCGSEGSPRGRHVEPQGSHPARA